MTKVACFCACTVSGKGHISQMTCGCTVASPPHKPKVKPIFSPTAWVLFGGCAVRMEKSHSSGMQFLLVCEGETPVKSNMILQVMDACMYTDENSSHLFTVPVGDLISRREIEKEKMNEGREWSGSPPAPSG
jgi:hypothetical protein